MAQNLWLVALPDQEAAYNGLKDRLKSIGTVSHRIQIPSLPIGTLDSLIALTDDLVKVNTQVEVIT